MNFWRKGVGLEYMLFIARSLELRALPYALNRPPRAAASFNPGLEVLRGGSGGAPMALRRYERAVGDAVPPIAPKTAKNLEMGQIPLSLRSLRLTPTALSRSNSAGTKRKKSEAV